MNLDFAFQDQVVVTHNNWVRDQAKNPMQVFVIGKVRWAHLKPTGTRGVFSSQEYEPKQQLTLEGVMVETFYQKLGSIIPEFVMPVDTYSITLRRPLESKVPLLLLNEDKSAVSDEAFLPGCTVICTTLVRHYSFMQKGERRSGFSYQLLAVRLLTATVEEEEVVDVLVF